MSEEKSCICPDGPMITQGILDGYRGNIICAKCKGLSEYPRKTSEYEGKDEIEKYLFELDANSKSMSFEKAVLKMLLRIESVIKLAEAQNVKAGQIIPKAK